MLSQVLQRRGKGQKTRWVGNPPSFVGFAAALGADAWTVYPHLLGGVGEKLVAVIWRVLCVQIYLDG